MPLLKGYKMPNFSTFSGEDNKSTMEHIGWFTAQSGEASKNEFHKLYIFPLSLTGVPFLGTQICHLIQYKALGRHVSGDKQEAHDHWRLTTLAIKSGEFKNILLDTHLYQVFSDEDKNLSLQGHIDKTFKWKHALEEFGADKIIVGEWSAALTSVYDELNPQQRQQAVNLYRQAQELAFANTAGHFYWSYKAENVGEWGLC